MFFFAASTLNNFSFLYGRQNKTFYLFKCGNIILNHLWREQSLRRATVAMDSTLI